MKYATAGESHGPELTVIVEDLPAGVALPPSLIDADLARRQLPLGAGGRMAIEKDAAIVTSGVLAGKTTGAPIAIRIVNRNHEAWKGREVAAYTVARPGHADEAACVKYGYDDIRPALERASARETAARVAAGACARAFLSEFGIRVVSRIVSLGGETDESKFEAAVAAAKEEGETLGGVIEVTASGVPVGLGSHVSAERRLDARLASAVISIQAMKGVEFGGGFALAGMKGTETRGMMGGLAGGISDGTPIVLRAAMKPIPTTIRQQQAKDLATGRDAKTVYERSDVCPVPRAAVVVESAVAAVLADELQRKLGGDSIAEMKPRFDALPRDAKVSACAKTFWA